MPEKADKLIDTSGEKTVQERALLTPLLSLGDCISKALYQRSKMRESHCRGNRLEKSCRPEDSGMTT